MKENKKQIKERIVEDLKNKSVKSISYLQKEYEISFCLAKEIYLENRNLTS